MHGIVSDSSPNNDAAFVLDTSWAELRPNADVVLPSNRRSEHVTKQWRARIVGTAVTKESVKFERILFALHLSWKLTNGSVRFCFPLVRQNGEQKAIFLRVKFWKFLPSFLSHYLHANKFPERKKKLKTTYAMKANMLKKKQEKTNITGAKFRIQDGI